MPFPSALPLQFRSGAFSKPQLPDGTHELIWSTGAAVRRISFDDEVFDEVLDLSGADLTRLNAGAPVLDSHRTWGLHNVVGVVESASVRDGRGYATIRLSQRQEVAGIRTDIAAGILRSVSVGYTIDAIREEPRKGQPPLLRVLRWTPREISLVAIPADAGAQVVRSRQAHEQRHRPTLYPVRVQTGSPWDPIIRNLRGQAHA